MKKLSSILICYTLNALADSPPPSCPNYRLFEVSVRNNTSSPCTIIDQTMRRGYLDKIFYPLSIRPQEERKVIRIRDYVFQGSDVVLSYQCGDNKFATIESERDTWAGDSKYVKGWIWSLAGMNVSYSTHFGDCEDNQSANMVWTFY